MKNTVLALLPLAFASLLLGTTPALAAQVGWQQITVPAEPGSELAPIPVALYYPTQVPARAIPMGPFTVRVAINAPPEASVKGLILLSHGAGGTELGHSSLAEALAAHGYLVAALRHPGDNWQDRSHLQKSAALYFTQRPRQVSRVIDALLRDSLWNGRIAKDEQGPLIAAMGHSAGGYTALALAGGRPDLSRLGEHCKMHRSDDPIFCSMGGSPLSANAGASPTPLGSMANLSNLSDARVRAVVALSPVGAVFSADSLRQINVPTAIYSAQSDRFLVARFHADWLTGNLPRAEIHAITNAWHFAFMDVPSSPIPTEDGDIAANPPGFDRAALLKRLQEELPRFFDKAFVTTSTSPQASPPKPQ